ncbi:hypothetical protein [Lentibacillus amyloliquefaciens]|uniref:hypothetical protein n=1 Tax=Lentibacillus amyloliquefaciens TaxID=1472767 RepID=UPI0012E3F397|nr:hypothetical protein [Lentibacillus amyloliquefaciens]
MFKEMKLPIHYEILEKLNHSLDVKVIAEGIETIEQQCGKKTGEPVKCKCSV